MIMVFFLAVLFVSVFFRYPCLFRIGKLVSEDGIVYCKFPNFRRLYYDKTCPKGTIAVYFFKNENRYECREWSGSPLN